MGKRPVLTWIKGVTEIVSSVGIEKTTGWVKMDSQQNSRSVHPCSIVAVKKFPNVNLKVTGNRKIWISVFYNN